MSHGGAEGEACPESPEDKELSGSIRMLRAGWDAGLRSGRQERASEDVKSREGGQIGQHEMEEEGTLWQRITLTEAEEERQDARQTDRSIDNEIIQTLRQHPSHLVIYIL